MHTPHRVSISSCNLHADLGSGTAAHAAWQRGCLAVTALPLTGEGCQTVLTLTLIPGAIQKHQTQIGSAPEAPGTALSPDCGSAQAALSPDVLNPD